MEVHSYPLGLFLLLLLLPKSEVDDAPQMEEVEVEVVVAMIESPFCMRKFLMRG